MERNRMKSIISQSTVCLSGCAVLKVTDVVESFSRKVCSAAGRRPRLVRLFNCSKWRRRDGCSFACLSTATSVELVELFFWGKEDARLAGYFVQKTSASVSQGVVA